MLPGNSNSPMAALQGRFKEIVNVIVRVAGVSGNTVELDEPPRRAAHRADIDQRWLPASIYG
ncbi:MAG: hypothetical protein M3Z06_15045 [Actinomycetota bacterium]|nr:hypothetical protein [Actinomycetota bacterium]